MKKPDDLKKTVKNQKKTGFFGFFGFFQRFWFFCQPCIPPFVPKTRGVNTPCSTSMTLCIYSRFLLFSCSLNIVVVGFWIWLEELTCVTRISKNAVWLLCQNPLALMSSLASWLVLAVLSLKVSLVTGNMWGSASTSLQILFRRFVRMSLGLSWRWAINPPFLQLKACSTSNFSPHGHLEGRFLMGWL